MSVIIRDAVTADVASILEITNHAIAHTTAIYDYDQRTLDYQLQWFEKRATAGFPVLVAERDGKIVGYAS
jgi:L-amino acid N-acyltransferase YncA